MTNETAKRKIEMLDSYLQRKADYEESDHEAMMMAVKALEQQPCDDCISRQAVLDLAVTIETDDYSGNEIMDVVDIDDINALPPVQPKPKTDVLDKIRAEIENYKLSEDELTEMDEDSVKWGMKIAYEIIDKYKADYEPQESEDKE